MSSGDPTDGTRLIRALRLRNQGLVTGRQAWESPAEVAKGMLAMQGQDFAGVKHALSLRWARRTNSPTNRRSNGALATAAWSATGRLGGRSRSPHPRTWGG